MTMVCPVCKRGNGAWIGCHNAACTDGRNLIPVSPAVADLADARAEIARLTKERDYKQTVIERLSDHIEKAEAERDEARAQVTAAYEAAAKTCSLAATNYLGKGADTDLGSRSRAICDVAFRIRALIPADAKAALEAYGREKVREGMRQAVDLYPQGIAAILAAMEKEGGE